MNFRLKSWDVFSWTAMRGGLFRLENDFTAIWADNGGKEYRFEFRRGLVWDGASVPKIFRWYLPNIGVTGRLQFKRYHLRFVKES